MTDRPRRAHWPWSRSDDDKLREMVLADASTRAIADKLGRTVDAVRGRARLLNVVLNGKGAKR
jgi:hypothetical protein